MSTKKTQKSPAMKLMEKLTGGPLSIAEILWSLRKCDDLTQEEFAKILGISKQHLCDIEKKRKAVSPSRAALFAQRLGQSPAYFIQLALQEELEKAGIKIKVKVDAA